jgi:DNA-binding CsgD family transcriptional regulator
MRKIDSITIRGNNTAYATVARLHDVSRPSVVFGLRKRRRGSGHVEDVPGQSDDVCLLAVSIQRGHLCDLAMPEPEVQAAVRRKSGRLTRRHAVVRENQHHHGQQSRDETRQWRELSAEDECDDDRHDQQVEQQSWADSHRNPAGQGAQTPALIAATTSQPFTARQREIISLAAQGLSNQEIADRLSVSIWSVEGHLFRASQRVGANNREQLISIMRGS